MKATKMIKWVGMLTIAAGLTACGGRATAVPKPADTPAAAAPAPPTEPPAQPSPAADLGAPSTLGSPLTSPIAEMLVFGEAMVESFALEVDKASPGVVFARVKGALGDSCTSIDRIDTREEKGKVIIIVKTKRPADLICSQVIKTFEERVAINLLTKDAGDYTVSVNGKERQMSVDKDGNATVK
jgi:hypothetical protein